jgi:dynactin complex subunit
MDRQLWWSYLLSYGQQNILSVNDVFTHFRIHINSKSVSAANFFEGEFDRLKSSLFNYLNAPLFLKEQLIVTSESLSVKFTLMNLDQKKILASFASHYAEINYVNDRILKANALIKYVKNVKGFNLTKKEFKIWFLTVVIPERLFWSLKKIKGIF